MVPEAFDWYAPAPGLFRLHSHSQVALHPNASVQRIQRDTSWSVSSAPSTFQLCVPISQIPLGSSFRLPSRTDSGTACVSPCLLPCHSVTSLRPTNQRRTFFSAPILLPRPTSSSHGGAYVSTSRWSSFAVSPWLQSHSFFQLSILVFGCPFLSIDHSG